MKSAGGSSWEGLSPGAVDAQARILGSLSEEIIALMKKLEARLRSSPMQGTAMNSAVDGRLKPVSLGGAAHPLVTRCLRVVERTCSALPAEEDSRQGFHVLATKDPRKGY
jgi:hypothetical protein